MAFFLPPDIINDRQELMLLKGIDIFLPAVRKMRSNGVAVANNDGAREITAAAMLMRGVELLSDSREGPGARTPNELASRSIVECALRGRFLLVHPEGRDEFLRICREHYKRGAVQAKRHRINPPSIPAFIEIPPRPEKTRDLATIAEQLDTHDGTDPTAQLSATSAYSSFGGGMSDSAVHAGLASLKRFSKHEDGVLSLIEPRPQFTSDKAATIAGAWLGDLAVDVARVFNYDDTEIWASGVHTPRAAAAR